MAGSLWGKASDHLGRSLAAREDRAVHLALAELAERVNDEAQAAVSSRAPAASDSRDSPRVASVGG
jgi:uncharacterized protein HemY